MLVIAEGVEHLDDARVVQPRQHLFLDVGLVQLAGLRGMLPTLMSCYFVIFLSANSPLLFFTRNT